MSVFVKGPGNVNHDGVNYEPGDEIKDITDKQVNELLKANAVQTQPLENGRSNLEVADGAPAPTAEEVANAANEVQ